MKTATDSHLRRIATFLLASAVTLAALAGPAAALPEEAPRVLWVWERPTPALIKAVESDGFDTVYLHVPPGSASDRDIRQFVESAHEISVSVYALAGVPRWAQEPAAFFVWLDEVVGSERFDGIVIDIEPYLLADWNDPKRRAGLLNGFLGVLEGAQEKAGVLPMVTTVPFWWDDPRYQVNRDALLIEEVLVRSDSIAVMAYRDQLESDDGIIALAADEISLAAKLGKQVVVTLHVAPETLDKLTFHEEGRAALEAAALSLAETWRVGRGLAGVAIHSYLPYTGMAP